MVSYCLKPRATRAAFFAGLLAVIGPALAEDAPAPAPEGDAKGPVLVPVEPPAGMAPPAAKSGETDPCFSGQGSIKEVLDACAAFIASGDPDKEKIAAAHANRALGLAATRDYDAAIADLDKAIELMPEIGNLYLMRAAGYRAKQDFDKALADADEAVRRDPKRADFYVMRGMIYADKGDLDHAIEDVSTTIQIEPQSPKGYSKRGEFYRMKKDYDRAIADYTQVIALDSKGAKGYVDRGWVYVLKNDMEKAGPDFDMALTLHQNDASALVGRGVVKSRRPGGKPTDGSADISFGMQLEPGIIDEIKKLGVQ
jgi:tetratricopeptide (TPR) repeat protein